MRTTFLVLFSSLIGTFLCSLALIFSYPDPFLDFFFPLSIYESSLSFAVRDPQQFTAARVWGAAGICFFVLVGWGCFCRFVY